MATSQIVAEPYNDAYVSALLDRLRQPSADLAALLREAVREDGADKPLPFELVRAVLSRLQGTTAWEFLRAAQTLQLWKDPEHAWLKYQQFCLQHLETSSARSPILIPLVQEIWASASRGSALRGNAAYWLAEQNAGPNRILLEALIEAAPPSTAPGYYVRRLRLWQQQPLELEAVLPQAVASLADAWAWLGKERLADRAAVAALLALALRARSPVAAGRLREEVETLLAMVRESDGRSVLQAALDTLWSVSLCDTALRPPDRYEGPLLDDHLSETLRRLEEAEQPAEIDRQLWSVLYSADVARRRRSSSAALQRLETAERFLAQAGPEMAWAFHYLRALLCWSRLEYHAALRAVEEARCLAGQTGSRALLYQTHSLRYRIAHDLALQGVQDDSDAVLAALDQISARQGLPPGRRDSFSLGGAFGLATPGGYVEVRRRLRDLRTMWGDKQGFYGYLREHRLTAFGQALTSVAQECEGALAFLREEPLLFAQIQFDMAQLALAARYAWSPHDTLYQAQIKPCLDNAFAVASELEAYQFLGALHSAVARHKHSVLRQYESPIPFDTAAPRRDDLARLSQMLRATATASERRMLLRWAHRAYAEQLDNLNPESLSSDEALTFFEVLQELKQPSLEDDLELPVPLTPNAAPPEDDFSFDDEEILSEDVSTPPQETWRALVAQRLSREDALCLDFFFTNKQMYCFVMASAHGHLTCRLLSLGGHEKGKLRQVVGSWRGQLRATAIRLGSHPHSAIPRLEEQLRRNRLLPGPLEEILSHRQAGAIYVAPFLGLHGFPLHAVRAQSGWCLSEVGPVLRVAKTRQLAAQWPASSHSVSVLTGPEDSFQNAGRRLAERLRVPMTKPTTHAELREVLRASKIVALLGHGWFDAERPTRSRVALDQGLRLTLKDMQTLGLEGVEVVLLSCWAGWGMRGNLPPGELYSGPAAWMVGGAGAVLAPLWPVPIEAASQFLGDYLEARCRGATRANALRGARQQSDNYLFGGACRTAYVLWGTDSP